MLSLGVVVLLVVGALVVLLYQGVALFWAAEIPRLDPAPAPDGPVYDPRVSVVVAARNEDLDLFATLDSLARQDYPDLEVMVVDGGSTEATRAELERRSPSVQRVAEPPLPEGWVGKNWACWIGAKRASGEWLLFVDADVRLAPAAVRTTVAWAEREGAALATLAPRVEMVGFWERVVLPFYVQLVLTYFRAPHANRAGSRAALVNGQYWLVRRVEYDAVGGHEAVRGQLLEDVAIARRFRTAGKRLRLAWAPALVETRMYRDRREMFEGILKSAHGLSFSGARQAAFLVGLVGLFWLPLGLLPLGIFEGNLALSALGGFLWVALFGKHALFARAIGAPARYGLLYPVAVGFYVVVIATSLLRGLRRRPVTWKGRAYPLRP